ncbi:Long-chain-fatty-acid--CoA ligase [compost metagenome]
MVESIRAKARRTPIFIYAGEGEAPEGTLSYEQLIADTAPVEDAGRGGSDLACVMYTGGTTGFPKGVMQSHLNLWAACIQRMAEIQQTRDNLELMVMPLFHIAGLARVMCSFICGSSLVLVSTFEPGAILELMERESITDAILVPTMVQALLAHPDFARRDLSSLQRMTYGASPTAGEMIEQVLAVLPNLQLSHSYGLTEACPIVSTNPPENHTLEARQRGLTRSVGRGGFGVNVKIVDEEGREVPRGTVGEIIVRGPNIMQGYWNKPEETASALRDGWLFTGDGAYMDEQGYLFIVDRLKDMIVSGGENVYSAEVENAISSHPAVAQCAAIGIPSDKWGESVHAVIVLKPEHSASEEQIVAHCRERIAGYKCPRSVEFREAMPLSSVGKILKNELRKPYWESHSRNIA